MTVCLDTSVLVSLFQDDKHTDRAPPWIVGITSFVLSRWALTAFSSALAVKTRMRQLLDRDRRRFELELDQWLKGGSSSRCLTATCWKRVLSERCVSAPHGLHLAVAARHGCILATPDEDMATVARDLGLTVMVP